MTPSSRFASYEIISQLGVGGMGEVYRARDPQLKRGNFSAGATQVLVPNVGFDAPFAVATPDHSRILIRVPKDADKDRGEIRLLFGWAKGLARQGSR